VIEWTDIVASLEIGSVTQALPSLHDRESFAGVAIDSRAVQRGDLFVALPGEHADGHRFVGDALRRGARGALVRRDWAADNLRGLDQDVAIIADLDSLALAHPDQAVVIAVDEPLATLQRLSAIHRRRMPAQVIGITGSVGKTSTKEVAAALLRQRLTTLASGKSYNNEIGVPMTLLRLESRHEVAVVEMGTYGPGEIALLCELARPRFGIVTNVGVSHLDRMKTQAVIAQAKGELVEALPPDGAAILNIDDPLVRAMAERTRARPFFYGLDSRADLWADAIEPQGLDGVAFTAHYGGESVRLHAPLLGRHAAYIALPAIAIALLLGLDWEAIAAGLRDPLITPRIRVVRGRNGATILDDSYNAAPASCKAALEVLGSLPGRRTAVFGEMAELGPVDESGHREVGEAAAGIVDRLVVIGDKARWIGEAAQATSPALEVRWVRTNTEAAALLRPELTPEDVVLVKGARVAETEQVVEALRADEETG
jgi:UDP-N-acetylmuramoyl-tripeptide--D-alanyl-D-alanine ligase